MKTYEEADKLFNDFYLKLNEFIEPFKKDFNPAQVSFSLIVYSSMLLEISRVDASDDDNQDIRDNAYRIGKEWGVELKKMKIGEQ